MVGRAWSGAGRISRLEFGVDGAWRDATVDPPQGQCVWQRWSADWQATRGEHEIACRATDAVGERQPLDPPWDLSGFGNNAVQRVQVTVRN